jgi:hypothetical protein
MQILESRVCSPRKMPRQPYGLLLSRGALSQNRPAALNPGYARPEAPKDEDQRRGVASDEGTLPRLPYCSNRLLDNPECHARGVRGGEARRGAMLRQSRASRANPMRATNQTIPMTQYRCGVGWIRSTIVRAKRFTNTMATNARAIKPRHDGCPVRRSTSFAVFPGIVRPRLV